MIRVAPSSKAWLPRLVRTHSVTTWPSVPTLSSAINGLVEFGGFVVERNNGYADGADTPVINAADEMQVLSAAGMFELELTNGSRVIFRPPGTDSKAKACIFARGRPRRGR